MLVQKLPLNCVRSSGWFQIQPKYDASAAWHNWRQRNNISVTSSIRCAIRTDSAPYYRRRSRLWIIWLSCITWMWIMRIRGHDWEGKYGRRTNLKNSGYSSNVNNGWGNSRKYDFSTLATMFGFISVRSTLLPYFSKASHSWFTLDLTADTRYIPWEKRVCAPD